MVKRGISATIEEWLLSAEYILAGGNNDVILCERGIRTFETATRNTFDISAIPVVKKLSHLPIVADPSHGAGRRDMVAPMARAAVAAGADGLIIEVHNDPDRALSDGAQSMYPAAVRPPDGGAADHRAGDRPQHLPGTGRRRGVGAIENSNTQIPNPKPQPMPHSRPSGQEDTEKFELRVPVPVGFGSGLALRDLTATDPPFSSIAIVGLGLIGGSIALGVRERWPSAPESSASTPRRWSRMRSAAGRSTARSRASPRCRRRR